MTEGEINKVWKPIDGFKGVYEVSNFGNVKSLPRNGTVKKDKVLAGGLSSKGYRMFNLSKNGCSTAKTAHRLG